MRVGRHGNDKTNNWKIGDMPINETESYKYLGDIVTADGKNTKNLETRREKAIATTISIKTITSNEIFTEIGASTLINLHETTNLTPL